jgi:endo-1,3(4)-beta-glucanase
MGKPKKTVQPVKLRRLIIVLVVLLGMGGILWWFLKPIDPVTQLQQRSRTLPTLALAHSGLTPPTNKWFSSLAFKQPSDPVFAYPLAFQTTTTGFAMSQPRVTAQSEYVDASFVRDIGVTFGTDVKSYMSAYDDLSVELELREGNTTKATVRITQGSPYLFISLRSGAHFAVDAETMSESQGIVSLQRNGRQYELRGQNVTFAPATGTVTANADTFVAIYAAPTSANTALLREGALHQITGTQVSYKIDGAKAQTTFSVTTKDGQPTIYGLLPHQTDQPAKAGTATTLLGTQSFQQGSSFTFSTPLPDMPGELPISKLQSDQRAQLSGIVKHDVSMLKFTATDTYYAGKQLYRAAQLLQLSHQLGLTAEAATVQAALKTQLTQWFDPNTGNQRFDKFFYYDTTLKGVVGEKPSFGSQDYNDHHFHYGYFLHAAAILGKYDAVFATEYESRVTMLARDIANPKRTEAALPYLRVFDQYAGHSWASGFAPFGSGNNQESSSEAVSAWHGMYLWAQVTGNTQLRDTAQWLFAREAHAALTYYA